MKTIGLLGTKYTMQQDFYKSILQKHGIEVLVPNENEMQSINRIIYEELCAGKILAESKAAYLDIISKLTETGAQGVILGCTEIGLLVQQHDTDTPLFDTTAIHAQGAALKSIEQTDKVG